MSLTDPDAPPPSPPVAAPEPEPDHVFEDRSGMRGRVVVLLMVVLILGGLVWLWDLGQRLLVDAPLSQLALAPEGTARPPDALVTLQPNTARPCQRDETASTERSRLVLGYLPAADATALTGLIRRCSQLDRVLADAFLLGAPDGTVVPLWANRNAALQDLADRIGLPGGAALTVARFTASTQSADLRTLLSPGAALDRLVTQMAGFLEAQPRPGLCLDLSAHPDLEAPILHEALSRLARATTRPGRPPTALCLIAGPEAGFWQDPTLVAMLDLAVVKGFREDTSPLVPPVAPDWFAAALDRVHVAVPGPKLVVALGSFGQVWQGGQSRSTRIGYAEALVLAQEAGATPDFDAAAGAVRLHFLDERRQSVDLWLLDAATVANQLQALAPLQSVAIWPLGQEDPTLWSLLQPDPLGRAAGARLAGPVDLSDQVLTRIGGPAVGSIAQASPGQRWVTLDATGTRVLDQGYAPLPLPNRLTRRGIEVAGGIVLAFDGLPETDQVAPLLATLSDHRVKAAFFADLATLLRQGPVAERLVAAGHVLGLRQLPPLPERPESRLAARIELNFQQLYLSRLFGAPARLVLLRPGAGPPQFSRDAFAAEADLLARGLVPLRPGFDAPVGPIDPAAFVDRILREGAFGQTQVVTLDLRYSAKEHLAALPALLARMTADGFTLLPPDQATRTDRPLPGQTDLADTALADRLAFTLADFLLNGVTVLFFVMLVISAIFSLAYIALSLIRRPHPGIDPQFTPPVTVVIPAFNEEKVILACVRSVLCSDYPDFQVVIVDDGSTDRTSDVVGQMVAENPRVHLLREENAGKWHAANLALGRIDTPIFIAADADSIFLPDTIRWLVQPFRDPGVGAVAGLVEVGNRENLLGDFQHQEYMVTQNVLRRAHEFFDGILVVPGAVGAWRTEAVRKGGGFSGATITEDADLTVAVHRAGYRVRFEERARSITEAPVTIRAFLRQRLRWQLGMLQVSWKHRGVIPSGLPVGFSVVDSIWFGPLSLLLALLDDVVLVTVLGLGAYSLALRQAMPGGTLPILLFTSYFIMTGIEVLRTLTAFWFERRWEWKTLLLIPFLRFGYRQLLYLTAIRGLFRALTGHPTGWYKIDRTGTRLKPAGSRDS